MNNDQLRELLINNKNAGHDGTIRLIEEELFRCMRKGENPALDKYTISDIIDKVKTRFAQRNTTASPVMEYIIK